MTEEERQENIAELRDSLRAISTYMPAPGAGFVVLSTGVAVLNTQNPTRISPQADMKIEDIVSLYACSHESIHVSQVATTLFVFDVALQFSELVAAANRIKKSKSSKSASSKLTLSTEHGARSTEQARTGVSHAAAPPPPS